MYASVERLYGDRKYPIHTQVVHRLSIQAAWSGGALSGGVSLAPSPVLHRPTQPRRTVQLSYSFRRKSFRARHAIIQTRYRRPRFLDTTDCVQPARFRET